MRDTRANGLMAFNMEKSVFILILTLKVEHATSLLGPSEMEKEMDGVSSIMQTAVNTRANGEITQR